MEKVLLFILWVVGWPLSWEVLEILASIRNKINGEKAKECDECTKFISAIIFLSIYIVGFYLIIKNI
jgi:hypothetical protein